jgi:hypothetical protein
MTVDRATVTIRRCQAEDVADVLAFIDVHWKPGHIFTRHRGLFDWQHALRDRPGEYSIAIARRTADRTLLGILGYIPTRLFDSSIADNTVWLALWKVRDDADSAGLGLKLLTFVTDSEPHTTLGVVGFKAAVAPIYRALGFTTGELRHYVLPNPDVDRFEIATLHAPVRVPLEAGNLSATPIDAANASAETANLQLGSRNAKAPEKTAAAFIARYLQHPIYRYRCDVIASGSTAIGLLATRTAAHSGRTALRIIDYLGPDEAVPGLGSLVLEQIRTAGAEYADVYNWGIDPDLFARAGFLRIDPDGDDVVPDHFEPFEASNIRLRFAIKSDRPVVLFKGDGDQDRPSQLSS